MVGVFLVLLAGAVVVLAAVSGEGDINRWSDISLIWLIAPMLLLIIILIAMTAAMVYLFRRMLPVLPRYSHLFLSYFTMVSRQVKSISNASVEPFLRAQSLSASLRAFKRSLRRKSG